MKLLVYTAWSYLVQLRGYATVDDCVRGGLIVHADIVLILNEQNVCVSNTLCHVLLAFSWRWRTNYLRLPHAGPYRLERVQLQTKVKKT